MREKKKEILYIFDGIEEAFEKEYEINKPGWWKDKDTHWKYLMEFCVKYTALEGAVVPSHQTQCLIETKQQYANFDKGDLLSVIENLGRLANLLYMADRDLFFCTSPLSEKENRKYKPLQRYYQRAVQRVLWRVATFTQDGTSGFVDFETKLREVMGEMESWEILMNTPVLFGLKQQGHLPTIERMLKAGATWKEIGKEIGWDPETAKEDYGWHIKK